MAQEKYKKSQYISELLLNSAEKLFAERGYYGVSVRDITGDADVRNASINYHFGSKEQLFTEVIRRRAAPLGEARLRALENVEIDQSDLTGTLDAIVAAFACPMFGLVTNGEPGWRHYCVLIAHISVQSHMGHSLLGNEYNSVALAFLDALARLRPEADEYRIQCAYQFMLSTTLYAVCDNGRIDSLSGGKFRSDDLDRLEKPFLEYVSGGIKATLTEPMAAASARTEIGM